MLWHKAQGAGGTVGGGVNPSFDLSIAPPLYSAVFAVGEKYVYFTEPVYPNSTDPNAERYRVSAIDVSTGSPGAKVAVLDQVDGSVISSLNVEIAAFVLTTGEEAVAAAIYDSNENRQYLAVNTPEEVVNEGDQYLLNLGTGSSNVRNNVASAGEWVAYFSHANDRISARRFRLSDNRVQLVQQKNVSVSNMNYDQGLAIESTGTYAYITYNNTAIGAFITAVINLNTGAETDRHVFSAYPGIVNLSQHVRDGKLYMSSTNYAHVFDVSTPGSITHINSVTLASTVYSYATDEKLYVTNRLNSSYEVFDILTGSSEGIVPATPDGDWKGTFVNTPADVRGQYIFMPENNTTKIFDASDLSSLSLVGSAGYASIRIEEIAVSADGNTLYAFEADATNGLLTLAKYDVTNKASPALLGRTGDLTVSEGVLNYYVGKPVIDGNLLYTTLQPTSNTTRLYVFDVSGSTPTVVGSVDFPSTQLYADQVLKYGNSVFAFGYRYAWEVDVTNPASPSHLTTNTSECSAVLLDGDYLYTVSTSNGAGSGGVYFEVYDLAGRTPGSALSPIASLYTGVTVYSIQIPVAYCITKVGDEVFTTIPNSYECAMLRVDVSTPSAPAFVYASGTNSYGRSAFNTSGVAKTFLLHPDGETFTTLGGQGFGAAKWNRVTGLVDQSVIDTGALGLEPRAFANSTKLITLSWSGRISIGDL